MAMIRYALDDDVFPYLTDEQIVALLNQCDCGWHDETLVEQVLVAACDPTMVDTILAGSHCCGCGSVLAPIPSEPHAWQEAAGAFRAQHASCQEDSPCIPPGTGVE